MWPRDTTVTLALLHYGSYAGTRRICIKLWEDKFYLRKEKWKKGRLQKGRKGNERLSKDEKKGWKRKGKLSAWIG